MRPSLVLIRALHLALVFAAAAQAACKEEAPSPRRPDKAEATPDYANAFRHSERWDPTKKALVVEMTISPGFHAYTTGETTGKPLAVELAADSDLTAAGAIEYPKGEVKELAIGRSVIVEGSAQIVVPLQPKDPAKAAPSRAKGTLRYQVCTEKACDRPRSVAFETAVSG